MTPPGSPLLDPLFWAMVLVPLFGPSAFYFIVICCRSKRKE